MSEDVLELKYVINAWESSLLHDRFLMDPSTVVIVEATIHYLKGLESTKEGSEKHTENSL